MFRKEIIAPPWRISEQLDGHHIVGFLVVVKTEKITKFTKFDDNLKTRGGCVPHFPLVFRLVCIRSSEDTFSQIGFETLADFSASIEIWRNLKRDMNSAKHAWESYKAQNFPMRMNPADEKSRLFLWEVARARLVISLWLALYEKILSRLVFLDSNYFTDIL